MANGEVVIPISRTNLWGHLPEDERPKANQPWINFENGLFNYEQRHKYISEVIFQKRTHTQNNTPAGRSVAFLTRPHEHRNFFDKPRQRVAEMIAELIKNVYGDGYPLSNKDAKPNLDDIESGRLLAYLGIEGPKGVFGESDKVNGKIYENPDLLLREDVVVMAACGIVKGDEGFAELGRFARRQENNHFDGGAIVLEMIYDWMRNRHGLMEGIHTLYADMRAANHHGHSPHSGNVQSLLLGHGGMGIVSAAPMYDVNGIEPMMKVALYRDPEVIREYNKPRTVVLPTGVKTDFLRALWQNQLGVEPNLIEVPDNELTPTFGKAKIEYNGKHIYTGIKINPNTQSDNYINLDEGLTQVPEDAPVLFAQVEAESKEGAATQKKLMEQGFVHCGIMPAQKSEYLKDPSNRSAGIDIFETSATVFMVKLGKPIKEGKIRIAKVYYPTPGEAKEKELHGRKQMDGTCYVDGNYMRTLLYENDQLIRDSILK